MPERSCLSGKRLPFSPLSHERLLRAVSFLRPPVVAVSSSFAIYEIASRKADPWHPMPERLSQALGHLPDCF